MGVEGPRGEHQPEQIGSSAARVVLIARFEPPPGALPEALHWVRQLDAAAQTEPGCAYYRHAQDVGNPHSLILAEAWSDLAALHAHFRTPHFTAFRAAARRLRIRSVVAQYDATGVAASDTRHFTKLLP